MNETSPSLLPLLFISFLFGGVVFFGLTEAIRPVVDAARWVWGTSVKKFRLLWSRIGVRKKQNWLTAVEVLIQEAVQLKHRAGQPQWNHYHHQDWRNDYYSWLKKLLSAIKKKYNQEKVDYVKGYIADKPKPPKWPAGDIQNFITEDAWKLEGELEWLRGERENLKPQR